MKQFTTITEFKNLLKVGSKIRIIEHLNGVHTEADNDVLWDEATIVSFNDEEIVVEVNSVQVSLNIKAIEMPRHSQNTQLINEPFCTIFNHRDISSITFFSVNQAKAFSFALQSDEKSCCPVCEGHGFQFTHVTTYGKPGQSISFSNCFHCKGKPVSEEQGEHIQVVVDYVDSLHCKCDSNTDAYYVADNMSAECKKHHWRCKKCFKIKQIG